MAKLHHELWVTHGVNAVLGPAVAAFLRAIGRPVPDPSAVIPDYLAMLLVITLAAAVFSLVMRRRLSVEDPGPMQVLLEDLVGFFHGTLDDFVGPKGRRYLPLVVSLFLLILLGNLTGLVPGLMAPTSSINVTLGCAITVWVYYHYEGVRAQGLVAYIKHFAAVPDGLPPGIAQFTVFIMFVIEIISHASRVLSLSLRLFGNIFAEELVILILAMLVPFVVPLPMMLLGIVTATLQAAVFVILTMIYLGGAVAGDHGHDDAEHAVL
jgi:F-type H+-transporting ATPase subunit a